MPSEPLRILVIEEHQILRESLHMLLNQDERFTLCDSMDADEALKWLNCPDQEADVVLIGLRAEDDQSRAVKLVRKACPDAAVIGMVGIIEDHTKYEEAGCDAVWDKSTPPHELIDRIAEFMTE
ncbi:response regulator transcription factor [Stratiformator vulcanicus]|uniref:Response regulatory domain-containing protein n=1 Tax=Stratiformator vulcanicus TaxID=2527980 RepID=A0A517QZL2_9PLAN|nr:response regulator transcription factor [Stratiformator vulcanicus]QDT37048.1 hypothetical protein Pan189_14140 [Stratiformator vulcanicus]